jgi:hypothetical protein
MKMQSFEAARAVINDEHLVLLNAKGKLVALFLFNIVESWSEVEVEPRDRRHQRL